MRGRLTFVSALPTIDGVRELLTTLQDWARRSPDRGALLEVCLRSACRYGQLRAEWFLAGTEARAGIDSVRRFAHDAFIASCNALSRAMGDPANRWRGHIGDVREDLGDFACLLEVAVTLSAR